MRVVTAAEEEKARKRHYDEAQNNLQNAHSPSRLPGLLYAGVAGMHYRGGLPGRRARRKAAVLKELCEADSVFLTQLIFLH